MLAIITVRYTPTITVTKRVRIRTATYRTTRDTGRGTFFAGTASGTGEPGSRVNSAITYSLQERRNEFLRSYVDHLHEQAYCVVTNSNDAKDGTLTTEGTTTTSSLFEPASSLEVTSAGRF